MGYKLRKIQEMKLQRMTNLIDIRFSNSQMFAFNYRNFTVLHINLCLTCKLIYTFSLMNNK